MYVFENVSIKRLEIECCHGPSFRVLQNIEHHESLIGTELDKEGLYPFYFQKSHPMLVSVFTACVQLLCGCKTKHKNIELHNNILGSVS